MTEAAMPPTARIARGMTAAVSNAYVDEHVSSRIVHNREAATEPGSSAFDAIGDHAILPSERLL